MTPLLIGQLVLLVVVFHALLLGAAGMVWFERRLAAALQQRSGPIRVGWQGWLQPFADVIKLMFKEELRPQAADAFLFALAPIIAATCAFAAFSNGISQFHTSGLEKPPLAVLLNSIMSASLRVKCSLLFSSTSLPRVPAISKRLVPGASPVEETKMPVAPFAHSR